MHSIGHKRAHCATAHRARLPAAGDRPGSGQSSLFEAHPMPEEPLLADMVEKAIQPLQDRITYLETLK
jgi:hypothetical protein